MAGTLLHACAGIIRSICGRCSCISVNGTATCPWNLVDIALAESCTCGSIVAAGRIVNIRSSLGLYVEGNSLCWRWLWDRHDCGLVSTGFKVLRTGFSIVTWSEAGEDVANGMWCDLDDWRYCHSSGYPDETWYRSLICLGMRWQIKNLEPVLYISTRTMRLCCSKEHAMTRELDRSLHGRPTWMNKLSEERNGGRIFSSHQRRRGGPTKGLWHHSVVGIEGPASWVVRMSSGGPGIPSQH